MFCGCVQVVPLGQRNGSRSSCWGGVGCWGSEKPRPVGIFTSSLSTIRLSSTFTPVCTHVSYTFCADIFSWETNSFWRVLVSLHLKAISFNMLICYCNHRKILHETWKIMLFRWFPAPRCRVVARTERPGSGSGDARRPVSPMGRESQGCPSASINDHFLTDEWMEVIISPRDNLSATNLWVDFF